jgi:hypothetical protein
MKKQCVYYQVGNITKWKTARNDEEKKRGRNREKEWKEINNERKMYKMKNVCFI